MTSVKENLIAARALIDTPEKWGKGKYEVSSGCYCAMGALGMAGHGDVIMFTDEEASALRAGMPSGYFSITRFNDRPNTTHADILALFDRAIAACTAEQVA